MRRVKRGGFEHGHAYEGTLSVSALCRLRSRVLIKAARCDNEHGNGHEQRVC